MTDTKQSVDQSNEAAKRVIEEDKKARARSDAEYAQRMKGKPTPTQEENDIVNAGGHVWPEHEDDGSGPDPNVRSVEHDNKSSSRPASYSKEQTSTHTGSHSGSKKE
jgi:hypothetical protein